MSSAGTAETTVPAAAPPAPTRTLVVGLGNPLLGDDGIGWRVVDLVEARLGSDPDESGGRGLGGDVRGGGGSSGGGAHRFPTLERLAVGGLALMERLVGYDRAILVDAIVTGDDPPGTVRVAPLSEVATRSASHLDSSHDAPLATALDAGRALGAELPAIVTVVTVEAERLDTFDESLSPPVAAAVWPATDAVLDVIGRG